MLHGVKSRRNHGGLELLESFYFVASRLPLLPTHFLETHALAEEQGKVSPNYPSNPGL